jgi:dipeptidyl aminopeptidase/acylaminoacyl peptidase
MGWTKDDEHFYVYDKYDIWKLKPNKKLNAERITKGRESKVRYRYTRLDREEKFISKEAPALIYTFNEIDKSSGYGSLDLKSNQTTNLLNGNYRYGTRPNKAKNANNIVFTQENFETFPDIYLTTDNFKTKQPISDANPQQKDYRWGKIELFDWTATDGTDLQGLLVKPDDFDPGKKYPLLVNFYERSSDGLNRYRAPAAGRSSINYSIYVNKGYIIFNPDVIYTDGYPGKSCENAVLSGIEALLKEGYIDEENIGIQGHSWGGYQVAHLLTKTDIFKCAESGAPVVNMVSAYGGIRWGSGMSRQFQYERTQSRLGATLWERPDLYLENSPIFNTDKVNTPVLILHNDKDGAVPWYQGIEYFVALRRLGKPAWMLNYNGEPHWPVKRQNRVDFQTRMMQFFDHYLMDAPKPKWMKEGVSAINKGINQGLEYDDNE